MPSATPNSRIVEFAELAIAKSASGSPSSTAVALGAKVRPMPTPAIASAGHERGVRRAALGERRRARPATPACSTSPVSSSGRSPVRGASSPAIGATTIGAAVHGRVRMPASSGRVALHDLEVLREQEHRAEHARA